MTDGLCHLRPCKDRHVDPPQPRQADVGFVCRLHHRKLHETVTDITDLYATLGLVALPGSVISDGRYSRRAEAPAPVRLEVLALRDYRTTRSDDGLMSVLAVVEGWARMVREERNLAPPEGLANVAGECNVLLTHMDWICEQPWIDEMWTELSQLHSKLRSVHGEERVKPLGPCPAPIERGGIIEGCDGMLFPPRPGSDVVQCPLCRTSWSGVHLIHLKLGMEIPEAS